MANKRVLMKIYDGEWQFWAYILWLNCLVVFFSMGVHRHGEIGGVWGGGGGERSDDL